MAKQHGSPCWYELATGKGQLAHAGTFYTKVLGWEVDDSGMPDFTYHLAKSDGDMVAGLMEMPDDVCGMPPLWMVYFVVDDADKAVADIKAAGGQVHRDVQVIPNTGRFALLADPQGAGFCILEPEPMPDDGQGNAFDQDKTGHGNWHELMSTDPAAGFDFYSKIFGWQKSEAMDMGEMGTYQLFSHDGADIGGMMGLGNSPVPTWLAYFGVNGVEPAITRIKDGGGTVHHGPVEVPGGAFIAIAQDPQGAWFAVVGPKETTA
ncbi:VOC family protein [Paracoccus tegillarcae]|uniref:Glyoxalase/bleomycin resistance/extradiol dioxygenase family protein n=1 Tax=Paracoccus tegillarcae TaxID=1529068 RepID=A0A2K9EHV8_9RHOB|nr:VOC family protein [Paracoccus tegillarcae]AUH34563.1 glyoxalase/bleomycin resistance/extradiol dioxygenase family protein [Paracoccus tegillarcae]